MLPKLPTLFIWDVRGSGLTLSGTLVYDRGMIVDRGTTPFGNSAIKTTYTYGDYKAVAEVAEGVVIRSKGDGYESIH